jgi:hypothetical protein
MINSSPGADSGRPADQNQMAALSSLLLLLRPIFRSHWLRLACGFLALVAVDFLQLIIPRFVKSAVDGLAAGYNYLGTPPGTEPVRLPGGPGGGGAAFCLALSDHRFFPHSGKKTA